MRYRQDLFVIKKNNIILFLTALLTFLPSNIGALPVFGSLIVMCNNLVVGWILLNFVSHLKYHSWGMRSVSYISRLCISFYFVRMILVYIHGGNYTLHNWVSLGKAVIAILWFEAVAKKSSDNRRVIMYAFWCWVIADAFVTFLWPAGAPFLNGGYILGWKNNKIEFLFIGNLLALIEIKSNHYTIRNSFFKMYLCFAAMTIAVSYIVDSGTSLLIIVLLTTYIFWERVPILTTKFPASSFIVIFHCLLWCAVILNFSGHSLVGALIEKFTTRDATFTGRIYVWASALLMISRSLITGYVKGFSAYGKQFITTGPLVGMAWEMAHNQILEILMQGGLVLFVIFAAVLLACLYKNRKSMASMRLARWALFCLMFSYLTEAYLNSITFVILLTIYYTSEWCSPKIDKG